MEFSFRFNEEKNQLLKATRNVSFEEVLIYIKSDDLLANIAHPSAKRPNQRLFVIKINNYAYLVPYIINLHKKEIFLKTIYPSREFTRIYLRRSRI